MKKTQLKDANRNIRKRIVSYLSICLVVMLGVGAFLATRYMEAGLVKEAAGYYSDRDLKDFELISSLGASEASIEAISGVEGVVAAEGVMEFDGTLQAGDAKYSVTTFSRTEKVSVPLLTDGKMPSAGDECAIGEDFAATSGIKIGDKVKVRFKVETDEDPLKRHEFTVTGFIKHPDYVHRKLVDTVVLPLAAYDMSVTDDAYNRVFVRAEDVAYDDVFTQAYFDQTADTKARLDELALQLEKGRAAEVKEEAYKEIDDEWKEALAELEDAENEIGANKAKLDSELAKARKKLKNGEKKLSAKISETNSDLSNGKKSIKAYEKYLKKYKAQVEEYLSKYEEAESIFNDKLSWTSDAGDDVDKLIAYLDDPSTMTEDEYKTTESELASLLATDENKDLINKAIEYAKTDEGAEAAKLLEELTGEDISGYLKILKYVDADILLLKPSMVKDGYMHFSKDDLETMKKVFDAIDDVRAYLDDAKKELDDALKQIAAGVKELAGRKADLKNGKQELAEEKAKGEQKIKNGWAAYYSKKAKYESKLAEAVELLQENREEAEQKLAEAKAEVEDIDCDWLVLDRNANAGYVDVKASLDSLRASGLVFGLLFVLITALVCFSTITIIIEEQKKLIGTVKAFGFHRLEVLGKYLLFGVSAGVLGDILAIFTGIGLCAIIQAVYGSTGLYQYGKAATIITPVPTVIICIAMLVICAISSIIACSGILRSPASMLMNGQTAAQSSRKRPSTSKQGGSLYSKLILRNIRDDKARVIVSTAIVAFCCMLIGIGFSFKLSFSQMIVKQGEDINLFDMRVDMGSSVTDKERAEIMDVLDDSGVQYAEVVYDSHLFNTGSTITGMTVLAGEPDQIRQYMGIRTEDGADAEISSDGIIIPVRMCENYGYEVGSNVSILDSSMQSHDAPVTGTYTAYVGRIAVTTPEGCTKIFGEEYEPDSCFIMLGGADAAQLKSDLLSASEDISFEDSDDYNSSMDTVSALYNIIVYVTLIIAIFMSFMILTNLANIFVTRKKNELIVMRINGFSIKQTKGYLAKEAVLTTVVGLALGVLAGSLLSPYTIKMLEPADLQFDRSYHVIAWILAAGIEGVFSLIIYSRIFRKIKDFNLKDIA